jgi:hypothetical protein
MRRLPCLVAAAISVFSLHAGAQIWSDQVPQQRLVPLKESVESQMAESRWRLGPFRVDPAIKLGNLGYDDNVFGTETDKVDDYTATVGLGIRSIASIGPRTFLRIDAVPEYTWYHELSERRRFGWEAGGALLALFNRMQIEAGGRTSNTVAEINSEEQRPVPQQSDQFHANLEIDVLRRVSLFVGAETRSVDYDPEPGDEVSNVTLLERDEDAVRIGLRYKFRPHFDVFGMVEETSADFPNDQSFSTNEGDAFLVGASYDAERFYLNLVAGRRGIEYQGEGQPEFDEVTGSAFLSLRMFRRSELELTFHRKPVYSTFVENPFFFESRWGAGLDLPLGRRIILLAGIETGRNEYQTPVELAGGTTVLREDDADSWHAGIGFRVARSAVLQVEYRTDDFSSNIDSFSREITRLQVNLVFR